MNYWISQIESKSNFVGLKQDGVSIFIMVVMRIHGFAMNISTRHLIDNEETVGTETNNNNNNGAQNEMFYQKNVQLSEV